MERRRRFIECHPALVTWFVLSMGMCALFLAASLGEMLTILQRTAISIALVATAGLCARMLHGSKA